MSVEDREGRKSSVLQKGWEWNQKALSIVVSGILPVSVVETKNQTELNKQKPKRNLKNMRSLIKLKEEGAQSLQASEEGQEESNIFKWGGKKKSHAVPMLCFYFNYR